MGAIIDGRKPHAEYRWLREAQCAAVVQIVVVGEVQLVNHRRSWRRVPVKSRSGLWNQEEVLSGGWQWHGDGLTGDERVEIGTPALRRLPEPRVSEHPPTMDEGY